MKANFSQVWSLSYKSLYQCHSTDNRIFCLTINNIFNQVIFFQFWQPLKKTADLHKGVYALYQESIMDSCLSRTFTDTDLSKGVTGFSPKSFKNSILIWPILAKMKIINNYTTCTQNEFITRVWTR